MNGEFKLYPEERHWFSFNDYRAVLETMRQLQPATVLEFGPGSSTLALIEGGAQRVDSCEDASDWAQVYRERLEAKYPDIVRVHEYAPGDFDGLAAQLGDQRYDLGLVDAPRDEGPNKSGRELAIDFCLHRCRAVLIPTENESLYAFIAHRAEQLKLQLDVRDTGPLHGRFALLTPRAAAPDEPEVGGDSAPPADEPDDPPPSVDPATITTPESGLPPLTTRRRGRRKKGQA